MSEFHKYAWDSLSHNGWIWDKGKSLEVEDYEVYSMTILVMYEIKVYACISTSKKHLECDGHYGILWLETEHEYGKPNSKSDIDEMIAAMGYAEANLLLIGIPFVPDYKFVSNADKKLIKNIALRKKLNLEEQENEDG